MSPGCRPGGRSFSLRVFELVHLAPQRLGLFLEVRQRVGARCGVRARERYGKRECAPCMMLRSQRSGGHFRNSSFCGKCTHQTDRSICFIPRQIPRINIYLGNKKGRRITAPFWGWRGEKRVRSTRRHPERRKPSRRGRGNPPGRSPPYRTAEAGIRRRSTR